MIQLLALMGFAIRTAVVTRPHVAARLGSLAFGAVMET